VTQSAAAVPGVPQAVDEDRSLPCRADKMPVPGDTVGRFIVLETLGEGGMGIVYRAHDPTVGRTVALKVARGRLSRLDPRTYSRMRREAQALGRIRDPGIVGLFEFGEDTAGAYLALELVEGVHLRRWLHEAARPPLAIAGVVAQAATGLAAVHGSGLLHRDLKPTNILVTPQGRVVLIDFGLALGMHEADATHGGSQDSEPTCRTRMTRHDMVVGTTHYMSPEQLLGRELDGRADVFSLGVTLYEALWGVRPYPATTAYDLAVVYDRKAAPDPPRDDVPKWLRRAVLDAIAIDKDARTPGALELAASLRPPGGLRPRWAGVLFGALLVGGSFTVGYATRGDGDATDHVRAAVQPNKTRATP
jgi:serine/threonine protein kinase